MTTVEIHRDCLLATPTPNSPRSPLHIPRFEGRSPSSSSSTTPPPKHSRRVRGAYTLTYTITPLRPQVARGLSYCLQAALPHPSRVVVTRTQVHTHPVSDESDVTQSERNCILWYVQAVYWMEWNVLC